MKRRAKLPESVLVLIHTPALEVLLIERVDHPGFWQSVTGSRDSPDEALLATACREVLEETGWAAQPNELRDWKLCHTYSIYPQWRHRYAPGVTENRESVYSLAVAQAFLPRLNPGEHTAFRWLPWRDAADACFSWTNALAIRQLSGRCRA